MWKLIYVTYHIPNNCVHEQTKFKNCGESELIGLTKAECLLKMMQYNQANSCWRYVPMRFEEVQINKLHFMA